MKKILISGVQPSGKLHIGNYLGAIRNFIEIQNSKKYKSLFFIADLHSLSENFSPQEKKKQIEELIIDYLALGLDFKKSIIFQQSEIKEHSELAILLNNITPLGELKRMTQFKDKSEKQKENVNAGLLYYPILMAADIILYDAKFVPVGDDQLQHLEFTRTLVRRFNTRFGKTFIEPVAIISKTSRIKSLNNPLKKMSKSDPEGCLFLDDSPEIVRQKIKKAVTDSDNQIIYNPQIKPGISNLLEIYSIFANESIKSIEKKFKNSNYQNFKENLASLIIKYFENYRKKKEKLLQNKKEIFKELEKSNEKARKIASKKITIVKRKMGILLK